MHATLPERRRTPRIDDLAPGQSGWTVPWAMSADQHGRLWLRGDYILSDCRSGTFQMNVTRDRDGAWMVAVPPGETYQRGHDLHPGWNPLPVAQVAWVDRELEPTADVAAALPAPDA